MFTYLYIEVKAAYNILKIQLMFTFLKYLIMTNKSFSYKTR